MGLTEAVVLPWGWFKRAEYFMHTYTPHSSTCSDCIEAYPCLGRYLPTEKTKSQRLGAICRWFRETVFILVVLLAGTWDLPRVTAGTTVRFV